MLEIGRVSNHNITDVLCNVKKITVYVRTSVLLLNGICPTRIAREREKEKSQDLLYHLHERNSFLGPPSSLFHSSIPNAIRCHIQAFIASNEKKKGDDAKPPKPPEKRRERIRYFSYMWSFQNPALPTCRQYRKSPYPKHDKPVTRIR